MNLIICIIGLLFFGDLPAMAVSFNDEIRPIFADRCFACHGPDSATRKANLRLDREEIAKSVLEESSSVAIIPGNPRQSEILDRITSKDPDKVMPPPESKMSVSDKEAALIERWIAEGAKWERHWAFIPPVKSPLKIGNSNWPRNAIDDYILDRLRAEELAPSPIADREHLLRRLSFDLTGLPPSIPELDAFLADEMERAYENAVDRLLASPAFGERLALEWLDVARYGDTDGLFEDHPRSIYLWRDWVVSAFNDNLPYSDFISWQLAGDLLPEASDEQKIATGFLRNNPTSNEGGLIEEDYRVKYLVDRVSTTATAFLGLTMECAQCHDHKFDPMTQRNYYEFAGFFNSLIGRGNSKGATAPTLTILPPGHGEKLTELDGKIVALETELNSTPKQLIADFERWLEKLERPIQWHIPQVISDSRPKKVHTKDSAAARPSDVRGRYLRISLPTSQVGFITLSEVEVYSGGQNIARRGIASQSSDYSVGSRAAMAIDGNANGTFSSCSCTTEQKDAWWEVDFGNEAPIDHIAVFNRNDCCPERLDDVSITVLDATRRLIAERKIGDAPFRSNFTLNPDAPALESISRDYVLTLAPQPGVLAALAFSSSHSSLLDSAKLELISAIGKSRELKLTGSVKRKFNADKSAVVGLEKVVTLSRGDRLKISLVGDDVRIQTTDDLTAAEREIIPQEREKRLNHFRANWPGFAKIRSRLEVAKKAKSALQAGGAVSMIAADAEKMLPTHVLIRGEYGKPGELVKPAAPGSILAFSKELPKNRLGLAKWMTDPRNPLTARVAVNRYWQMLFGIGLVKTSEDFGTQGERPIHRELLDYLAIEFIESGWDLKALLRLMVTSNTYRQSSAYRTATADRDPDNRLLISFPRQRLTAEFIRDNALASSGLLVSKHGGPGVHPYQPSTLFGRNAIGAANVSFKQSSGKDLYRRSLYTYWRRQIPAANMRLLGANGRTACRTRREKTNTPLQALVLLNDPQFVEAARALAERCIREVGTGIPAISHAFRLVTSRHAKPEELELLLAEHRARLIEFRADPAAAKAYLAGGGQHLAPADIGPSELAAYAAIASLLLNLDESISKS